MFIWPLVMTRTETLRTIQIALAFFRQDQNIQWALLMAATTMATLPIILVFLVLQRYFTQGIAMTGLKG
jgi:multiple sugar transport system permease protein